jgi:hypothetical protein
MRDTIRKALSDVIALTSIDILTIPSQFRATLADIIIENDRESVRHLLETAICKLDAYTKLKVGFEKNNQFIVGNLANTMNVYVFDSNIALMVIECIAELLGYKPTIVNNIQPTIVSIPTAQPTQTIHVPPTQVNPGTRKYKISDTGPAGGHIFYDKGSHYDGWQYLEAAPAHTQFNAEWGALRHDVVGTKTDIGTGRQNTALIVAKLTQLRETNRAAQLCVSLNINGFSDWFLPSKDELNLMYVNLHKKGVGGFDCHRYYWSSSQSSTVLAWLQRFFNGYQYPDRKNDASSVRAVRAF